jgi:hypothetical protein
MREKFASIHLQDQFIHFSAERIMGQGWQEMTTAPGGHRAARCGPWRAFPQARFCDRALRHFRPGRAGRPRPTTITAPLPLAELPARVLASSRAQAAQTYPARETNAPRPAWQAPTSRLAAGPPPRRRPRRGRSRAGTGGKAAASLAAAETLATRLWQPLFLATV